MKNISFGPYGAIFHIRATWGNKAMYALKEEKRHPNKNFFKLQMELKVLQAASGGTKEQQQHFPVLYDRSKESRSSMFIVMSLLGDSLAAIKFQQPKKICRSKSVRVYPNKKYISASTPDYIAESKCWKQYNTSMISDMSIVTSSLLISSWDVQKPALEILCI